MPLPPESQPPVMPLVMAPPLPLPSEIGQKPEPLRQMLALLLSLCLGLFLADAVLSLLDDSLILLWGTHLLTLIRMLVGLAGSLVALLVYGLIGLTPMIPKRVFLPIALFTPLTMLALVPLAIYFYGRLERIGWVISLCQLVLGLGMLCWLQGGLRFRWPLVKENRLGSRGFCWFNLAGFLGINVFVLLPATAIYLVICAAAAVGHFSEGFLKLRTGGFSVQVRNYVRNDGKRIQLVPMAHVGDASFYHQLSQSFSTNAVILMEGVSDEGNLLTNKVTYKRMATSLGLAEQHEEFKPAQIQMVNADVDISAFTTNTIGFLNLAMLFHAKGVNAETVLKLLELSPSPQLQEQLWDDLLRKRNRHLLDELRARLPDAKQFVVPWGVAHMPGIAQEIEASGFRLEETQEYAVIRFRLPGSKARSTGKAGAAGTQ